MLPRVRFAVRAGVVLGFGSVCLWSLAGESRSAVDAPSGSLIHYDVAGGESYFALSVRAPEPGASESGTPAAHDHVVLVDTSASQTGAHREQGLKVLESCLAAMPAGDRVNLMAVDVEVKPLSSGFFAPNAPETQTALKQLRRRVPLGATSLAPALTASLESFVGDNARSIIYIGDGMSTGRLIGFDELGAIVTELRRQHIPVHSYVVGPRTDLQLLGALATHTGGVTLIDEMIDDRNQSTENLGRKLARAADAPVFYADKLDIEPAVDQLLPSAVPPLRADRDTVVLGRGRVGETLQVVATGDARRMKWTIKPAAAQPGNTFLVAMWNMAERSEGWGVSVAGSELLSMARQEYEDQVGQLVALGHYAVAARDLKQAEQIAFAVRDADPANVEADTILNATQRVKAIRTSVAAGLQAPAPPEPGNVSPVDAAPEPGTVRESDLTDSYRDAMRIRSERLTKEVNQTIEAARKTASQDPDTALGGLKRILNTVTSAGDIDPVDRETLRRRVQNALDEITVLKQKNDIRNLQSRERLAAIQARRLAIDEVTQREDQMEQLIDKVRSLLNEGWHGNEEAFEQAEAVARAAWRMEPYLGIAASAVFTAEAAGQIDKVEVRMKALRADKFLEALYQVEKAHVPFPDEPPILWPAPEVWKDLTERRKKWASVDLTQYNKAEEKIRASLDKPTEVNFVDLPLEDAISYLKEYHGINIWIDKPALSDEGVQLDTPVTLQHSGVSFRSTLKLMLESMQLTWIIEDEVMKITTTQKAGEKLTTRVYPVADLVIPIMILPSGASGGGMGGMGGGMGGGMMGGGGGGMMGGGGGMMGGGGMFNVADDSVKSDKAPAEFNNSAVRNRKKKLTSSL